MVNIMEAVDSDTKNRYYNNAEAGLILAKYVYTPQNDYRWSRKEKQSVFNRNDISFIICNWQTGRVPVHASFHQTSSSLNVLLHSHCNGLTSTTLGTWRLHHHSLILSITYQNCSFRPLGKASKWYFQNKSKIKSGSWLQSSVSKHLLQLKVILMLPIAATKKIHPLTFTCEASPFTLTFIG